MKKSILILAAAFTFSSFFTSCRETADEETEMEIMEGEEELDEEFDAQENNLETENDLESTNQDGEIENTLEEGVNEVGENTGIDGTDDV